MAADLGAAARGGVGAGRGPRRSSPSGSRCGRPASNAGRRRRPSRWWASCQNTHSLALSGTLPACTVTSAWRPSRARGGREAGREGAVARGSRARPPLPPHSAALRPKGGENGGGGDELKRRRWWKRKVSGRRARSRRRSTDRPRRRAAGRGAGEEPREEPREEQREVNGDLCATRGREKAIFSVWSLGPNRTGPGLQCGGSPSPPPRHRPAFPRRARGGGRGSTAALPRCCGVPPPPLPRRAPRGGTPDRPRPAAPRHGGPVRELAAHCGGAPTNAAGRGSLTPRQRRQPVGGRGGTAGEPGGR